VSLGVFAPVRAGSEPPDPSPAADRLTPVALVKIMCAPVLLPCSDLCASAESYDPLRVVGTG